MFANVSVMCSNVFCQMPIKVRWGIVAIDRVLTHMLMGAWAPKAELLSSKLHWNLLQSFTTTTTKLLNWEKKTSKS